LQKCDSAEYLKSETKASIHAGQLPIIKINPEAEIMVSSDGRRMSRRTDSQIDAFTEDGFVSRKK
jgi:hypothetical protein